jgi:hypothetical protein
MASQFQFLTPATMDSAGALMHTLFVYEGPDWCLEELQNPAGTVVRCWSYEILETGTTPCGTLFREVHPRPRDWVGSCLLRTLQIPCMILKGDEKGVWLQAGGWNRLQWNSMEFAAAEAWRLQPPAAAAVRSPPTSSVVPRTAPAAAGNSAASAATGSAATGSAATGSAARGSTATGRTNRGRGGGHGRGRGRGIGGGRGGGGRGAAASNVCQIRLPATGH